jgi:hypothetical protein
LSTLGELYSSPSVLNGDTDFQEVCTRIGMMAMSENIESITVYRDDVEYRNISLQTLAKASQVCKN